MSVDLLQRVREVMAQREMIKDAKHVVVGVSGGPDSVCLLHLLARLRDEEHFTLSAVHVNHGFRPGAADEDQRFVEDLCREYDVPLIVKTIDVRALATERGQTPEEAGRMVRYEAFAEAAMKNGHLKRDNIAGDEQCEKPRVRIAVAHNRNDQVETVLMRLIRGTGTDGLAGIPYTRTDEYGYPIIRPLLTISRKDIEAYCAAYHLRPRHDHTNDEPKYFRNRIRLQLLPFLAETFGDTVEGAILRASENAAEDKEYFAGIIGAAIRGHAKVSGAGAETSVSFPLSELKNLSPAVRRRLVTALFARAGLTQDIGAAHLKAADALIARGETGKALSFPGGYVLELSYDDVVFTRTRVRNGDGSAGCFAEVYVDESGRRILAAHCNGDTALFDAEALDAAGLTPEWRTRRPGDSMRPKGMDGTKKLQDIFVDKKLPRPDRDTIMLFAAGNEILWIPKLRISRMFAL